MEIRENQFVFSEKYRPQTIASCILPKMLKAMFVDILKSDKIPNFIFVGSAGTGKTTVARALCNELGADFIFINGSLDGNIDTLRTKIMQFASSVSFTGGRKVVILDEADYLSGATQAALRGFIEAFPVTFIMTCNHLNKLTEPLHSRCSVVEFAIPANEKADMLFAMSNRAHEILTNEKITFVKKDVSDLIVKFFPDFRRILGELQRCSVGGTFDAARVKYATNESITELVNLLREKNFASVRKWVVHNLHNDVSTVFRQLYDAVPSQLEPKSVPQAILTIADYMYKSAFSSDHEITLVACLIEIMAGCDFKKLTQ